MSEIDERTIRYIEQLNEYPLLTFKQELELASVIQGKNGKSRTKAIDKLVTHNLKLVVKEAFRYARKTVFDVDDLIGYGNTGLMRAAERFNPKKFKTRFSTYATYWIREAIQDYIYKNGNVLTIPAHIINGIVKHKKIVGDNKDITDKQIKKSLKVNDSGLKRIREANIHVVSIDKKIDSEDDRTFGETIADEKAVLPSDISAVNDDYGILYEALNELDEVSKQIIMSQCMNAEKIQLRKLGEQHGLSGERIRQIKEKALIKLRNKINIKRKRVEEKVKARKMKMYK